jgi:hypothetical protein
MNKTAIIGVVTTAALLLTPSFASAATSNQSAASQALNQERVYATSRLAPNDETGDYASSAQRSFENDADILTKQNVLRNGASSQYQNAQQTVSRLSATLKRANAVDFLNSVGAHNAAQILTSPSQNQYLNQTHSGDLTDATSITNLYRDVELMERENQLRSQDPHSAGHPLQVSWSAFAAAIAQSNAAAHNGNHNHQYDHLGLSENLAWQSDAVDTWYREKSQWQKYPQLRNLNAATTSRKYPNLFESVGHYLIMVDPSDQSMGIAANSNYATAGEYSSSHHDCVSVNQFSSLVHSYARRVLGGNADSLIQQARTAERQLDYSGTTVSSQNTIVQNVINDLNRAHHNLINAYEDLARDTGDYHLIALMTNLCNAYGLSSADVQLTSSSSHPANSTSNVRTPRSHASVATYYSPATGRHTTKGAIRNKYIALGGPQGTLGYPTSEEHTIPGGASQSFQHGQIHWSARTGAHYDRGAIQSYWRAHGWQMGWLGFPSGDELKVHGGVSQTFQHGTVFWSARSGAHAVHDGILNEFGHTRYEQGYLGFPIGDERKIHGGASQAFQHGQIHWSARSGAHADRGAIQNFWASLGWQNGKMGFPTSDEIREGHGTKQYFQHGVAHWDPRHGVHETR